MAKKLPLVKLEEEVEINPFDFTTKD